MTAWHATDWDKPGITHTLFFSEFAATKLETRTKLTSEFATLCEP
jgi:hypothetical protein